MGKVDQRVSFTWDESQCEQMICSTWEKLPMVKTGALEGNHMAYMACLDGWFTYTY